MESNNKIYSFFCFDREEIADELVLKIICYCGSTIDPEGWEVTTERGFISGMCLKQDIGKFYEFLQNLGIHEIINIIRG